jgi:hypothetical protein
VKAEHGYPDVPFIGSGRNMYQILGPMSNIL